MPKKKKEILPPEPPLPFKAVEMIQRAENGGSPLDNDNGFGHGTPLLIADMRGFVAFLKRANTAAAYTGATVAPGNHFPSKERTEWVEVHGGRAESSYHFMQQLYEETRLMLKKWDNFVIPVSPDEKEK